MTTFFLRHWLLIFRNSQLNHPRLGLEYLRSNEGEESFGSGYRQHLC